MSKVVPLCMNQYKRMFGTTRIPGNVCDVLKQSNDSEHIVVLRNGRFYKVSLLRSDGSLLHASELEHQMQWIVDHADRLGPPSLSQGYGISAMTGGNRSEWAKFREVFCSDGENRFTLDIIESALFLVVLDEKEPKNWSDKGLSLIHGDGGNRWFDKSICLVVFADGQCGCNVEHSWADAPGTSFLPYHSANIELNYSFHSSIKIFDLL